MIHPPATDNNASSNTPHCPFCALTAAENSNRILRQTPLAFVIRDGYPVSPGHTLIIPRRHIASLFECTKAEQDALLALLGEEKRQLDTELSPAAYNIGINDGFAAGQTVGHLHLHLIPRFKGDVEDPRGGIRWVIADKANYWDEKP